MKPAQDLVRVAHGGTQANPLDVVEGVFADSLQHTHQVGATVGAGNAIATIDQSTATSSGTTVQLLPFRITGLYPGVGNGSDPSTPFNVARVAFNYQLFKSVAG